MTARHGITETRDTMDGREFRGSILDALNTNLTPALQSAAFRDAHMKIVHVYIIAQQKMLTDGAPPQAAEGGGGPLCATQMSPPAATFEGGSQRTCGVLRGAQIRGTSYRRPPHRQGGKRHLTGGAAGGRHGRHGLDNF